MIVRLKNAMARTMGRPGRMAAGLAFALALVVAACAEQGPGLQAANAIEAEYEAAMRDTPLPPGASFSPVGFGDGVFEEGSGSRVI